MNDDHAKGPPAELDLPPPPPEEYPRTFGNYLLLSPLARGGMGEVFLAKHGTVAGLEKHCVVKTLRPHLTDDREYTARFIDEARIVVQLNHRNICHVFDVGAVGERYYLAMEYIAGRDLRTVTFSVGEQGGVLNPGLTLHCVCEVLEALDYAHRHSDAATGRPLLLVHRDVSPQNVMVSWEGEVKLIDFGLAASSLKMEQTSPNVVMGKLAYMSPEQVRGEKVDGRSDQFAVGVMLYEVLVGERFYEGRSPYEIWGIAAQGGYRPRGWEVLDTDMRAMLDRALAATTQGRYATCNEFREALQSYRYARGLHGDGPMLRSLMQKVFQAEIDESRKTMALLSSARPRQPVAGVVAVGAEPTMSIARAPSLPNARAAADVAVREPTEPTERQLQPFTAPRRRPPTLLLAAAVALLGVLVGAALARQLSESGDAPPQASSDGGRSPIEDRAAAATAADDDLSPAGGGVTATSEPTSAAPTNAAPGDAAPGDAAPGDGAPGDAAPGDAAPGDAAPSDVGPAVPDPLDTKAASAKAAAIKVPAKKAPAKAKPHRQPPKQTPATQLSDAQNDQAASAADAAVEQDKRYATLNWTARLDELKRRCPSLACSAAVARHRDDYGRIDTELLIAWKAEVGACWDACRLPR